MICSSVHVDRFIGPSFVGPDSPYPWRSFRRLHQRKRVGVNCSLSFNRPKSPSLLSFPQDDDRR